MTDYTSHIENLLDASRILLSDIRPSSWAEIHRSMGSAESKFQGKFSYDITPYCREIVDCMAPDHPARIIGVMKGSGVGFSTGVIEPAIGWSIAESPANILFLVGHADLAEEAITKVDMMIDSCGIRSLIKPTSTRSRKTGDTNFKKEFAGGSLVSGYAGNHKLLRQRHVKYGFIDDYDAAKGNTKESGNTRKMIEQRFTAYYDEMKLFLISTPETRPSNIEEVFLEGDQRYYHVPCPCCGEMIVLHWSIEIDGTDRKEKGGIHWEIDKSGQPIKSSIGYICQKCSGFFTDRHKYDMNLAGRWVPTAVPFQPSTYSYHLSSLYAPDGMYDWEHYIYDYLKANPAGGMRDEHKHQTLVNLCWGLPYEQQGEEPKGNVLQKNICNYEIGTIPERLSLRHGNGRFVMLTCGADMNGTTFNDARGTVDDARLDYEIVGWTENGASYSIMHGSIGTFIPRENTRKHKEDRERWTYEPGRPNSVWPEFTKILQMTFEVDSDERQPRTMPIFATALDSGHYTQYAYLFVDKTNCQNVFAVKGKDADKFMPFMKDITSFHPAKERNKLYLLEVNYLKDQLASAMRLRWDEGNDEQQPVGFMNFPHPGQGKYEFANFFEHYESERRVLDKEDATKGFRWEKKASNVQNHMWDCRVYNMAIRDIQVSLYTEMVKIKKGTWRDFVDLVMAVSK